MSSIFDNYIKARLLDERLTRLGAGKVTMAKVTRKGKLKPVTVAEVRRTLRERRRKNAEALAAKLPARKLKRKLGRGAKKLAAKLSRKRKGAKFPFHPYLLMRRVLVKGVEDSVAINSTLTREQCRDLARLDRCKRLENRSWIGNEIYTIHLTKKGKLLEQVYPILPFVKNSNKHTHA